MLIRILYLSKNVVKCQMFKWMKEPFGHNYQVTFYFVICLVRSYRQTDHNYRKTFFKYILKMGIIFRNFTVTIQERWLQCLVKILFTTEHPVCNYYSLMVRQSFPMNTVVILAFYIFVRKLITSIF